MSLKATITVDQSFEKDIQKLGEYLAKIFYQRLMENIRSNKFGFVNSSATIKRKGRNLPMIDTGSFINQISQEGSKIFVRDGKTVSGLSFEELANILEFGRRDKGFFGFPVWRRTIDEFEKEVPKLINEYTPRK